MRAKHPFEVSARAAHRLDYSLRSCDVRWLPPSSSDSAERKALRRHLLQIGGAIEKLVSSSLFAKRGACFAHRSSSDHQRAPTDARREC